MLNMCTVPLVTWLIAVTAYVAHVCIHVQYEAIRYLAYMVYVSNLVCTFVSGTYWAITCEVCIVVGY